jgi:hypothetical protein
MAKDQPNSEDYLSRRGKESREAHQKKVDELFSTYPNSLDWADDLAKDVIVGMFDTTEFMQSWKDYLSKQSESDEDKRRELAWSLMVSLSIELRHLRSDAMSVVDGKVRYKSEKLRKKFADPSFLAEYVREQAGALDKRGMTSEANILRDAANILNEEF